MAGDTSDQASSHGADASAEKEVFALGARPEEAAGRGRAGWQTEEAVSEKASESQASRGRNLDAMKEWNRSADGSSTCLLLLTHALLSSSAHPRSPTPSSIVPCRPPCNHDTLFLPAVPCSTSVGRCLPSASHLVSAQLSQRERVHHTPTDE